MIKVFQYFPGLPRWYSGSKSACKGRRHGFDPWVRKFPWSRKWQTTPVFLPENFHEQRSLTGMFGGYGPCCCRESDMTEELSTHVSIQSSNHIRAKAIFMNLSYRSICNKACIWINKNEALSYPVYVFE